MFPIGNSLEFFEIVETLFFSVQVFLCVYLALILIVVFDLSLARD